MLLVYAAKGKNSKLAGRNKKAQAREDKKMVDGQVAAAKQRREAKEAVKKDPTLKYSKRGVVSSQPGQVSKAALKRIREVGANDGGGGRRLARVSRARAALSSRHVSIEPPYRVATWPCISTSPRDDHAMMVMDDHASTTTTVNSTRALWP